MAIDTKASQVISDLMRELASELDLHYEDPELIATEVTIEALQDAANVLAEGGGEPPEAFLHIVKRFNRAKAALKH